MGYPLPLNVFLSFIVLFCFTATVAVAQSTPAKQVDSTSHFRKKISDSARSLLDTTLKGGRKLLDWKKEQLTDQGKSGIKKLSGSVQRMKNIRPDSIRFDIDHPFKNLLITKPAIQFSGGYISYQFNYRANIDTPYVEKDIAQHNTTGNLGFRIAGVLPVRVNFWSRQSNSKIFRNMTDVQVSFNGAEFRNELQMALRNRLLKLAPGLKDSLTEKLYELKKIQLTDIDQLLRNSFSPQSLAEANEILNVPRITWRPNLPDSVNHSREDSLKRAAASLLDLYKKTMQQYARVKGQVDSLRQVYDKDMARITEFRKMVNGKWDDLISPRQWRLKLEKYGVTNVEVPPKYRWLMGLRNVSAGRSTMNYTDLTAKNISLNGINIEYNSWYYFAVAAGLVDYRFRDFAFNGSNKKPQYLYMVRAGIGRLERNYFIASVYRGQKQLFAASNLSSITVTGISAETRWQVNPTTWVTAEWAKSIAPDYRNTPPQSNTKFTLSDNSNQAIAFRLYSYIPVWGTRIEGAYKKTGANFQSFSSFQTNAEMESWSAKADQSFFHRKLRVTASVRKNEFSNPFLPQDYRSNTIFKSLTASFRMRKWPVITVGYQPMSQLTVLEDRVIENQFQTFTSTLYHTYSIRGLQTASTIMVNKFYNNNSDTGFIYYNATNLYWMQNFFFKRFTANIAVSHSKNSSYVLNVMDESIQVHIDRIGSVGFGVKINNLNNELVKVGGYLNGNIRVWRQDVLYLSYERGYLPGFNNGLVRNEMATVQFVKSF